MDTSVKIKKTWFIQSREGKIEDYYNTKNFKEVREFSPLQVLKTVNRFSDLVHMVASSRPPPRKETNFVLSRLSPRVKSRMLKDSSPRLKFLLNLYIYIKLCKKLISP